MHIKIFLRGWNSEFISVESSYSYKRVTMDFELLDNYEIHVLLKELSK